MFLINFVERLASYVDFKLEKRGISYSITLKNYFGNWKLVRKPKIFILIDVFLFRNNYYSRNSLFYMIAKHIKYELRKETHLKITRHSTASIRLLSAFFSAHTPDPQVSIGTARVLYWCHRYIVQRCHWYFVFLDSRLELENVRISVRTIDFYSWS